MGWFLDPRFEKPTSIATIMDSQLVSVFRRRQRYQPLFATIAGPHAHGYGCAHSPYEVVTMHLLSQTDIFDLYPKDEHVQNEYSTEELKLRIESYDIGTSLRKLCNHPPMIDGLFSPTVLASSTVLNQLREIAKGCITKNEFYFYRGFIVQKKGQLEFSESSTDVRETAVRVLDVIRTALTGIHKIRTQEVLTSLPILSEMYKVPETRELIDQYQSDEYAFVPDCLLGSLHKQFDRL